jgi:hypothetical protein
MPINISLSYFMDYSLVVKLFDVYDDVTPTSSVHGALGDNIIGVLLYDGVVPIDLLFVREKH